MKVKDLITLLQQHSPEAEVAVPDEYMGVDLPVRVAEGPYGTYRKRGRDGVVYLLGDYAERGEQERRWAVGR